jgi:STE24 endopeptidase
VALLVSLFFFVLTPIINTHVQTSEAEADRFDLNASRQPDGWAQAVTLPLIDFNPLVAFSALPHRRCHLGPQVRGSPNC